MGLSTVPRRDRDDVRSEIRSKNGSRTVAVPRRVDEMCVPQFVESLTSMSGQLAHSDNTRTTDMLITGTHRCSNFTRHFCFAPSRYQCIYFAVVKSLALKKTHGPDLPLLFKLHEIWSVDSQEYH